MAGAVAPAVVAVVVGVTGVAGSEPDRRGSVEFRFQDPAIIESSGLVVSDELFVTVNDSGDSGRVFVVDPADGRTVGVTTWSPDPVDVEAIAPAGPGEVWVGDIGDNAAARDSVTVARVPVGRGDLEVAVPTYELVYPDGARDAETLLMDPQGRLLVVTKGLLGGEVLRAPVRLDPDGPNLLRRVGTAVGVATDGAFFPDGRHLVVRTYTGATIYDYPGLEAVASFDLPAQNQGEGIAVAADGSVFVSTEGSGTPVLRVRVPARVQTVLAGPPTGSPSSPTGPPTATTAEPPTTSPAPRSDATASSRADQEGSSWLVMVALILLVLVLVGFVVVSTVVAVVRRDRPRG